jgi:hypothetical protein
MGYSTVTEEANKVLDQIRLLDAGEEIWRKKEQGL